MSDLVKVLKVGNKYFAKKSLDASEYSTSDDNAVRVVDGEEYIIEATKPSLPALQAIYNSVPRSCINESKYAEAMKTFKKDLPQDQLLTEDDIKLIYEKAYIIDDRSYGIVVFPPELKDKIDAITDNNIGILGGNYYGCVNTDDWNEEDYRKYYKAHNKQKHFPYTTSKIYELFSPGQTEWTGWLNSGSPTFSRNGGDIEPIGDVAGRGIVLEVSARAKMYPDIPISQLGQRVFVGPSYIGYRAQWYNADSEIPYILLNQSLKNAINYSPSAKNVLKQIIAETYLNGIGYKDSSGNEIDGYANWYLGSLHRYPEFAGLIYWYEQVVSASLAKNERVDDEYSDEKYKHFEDYGFTDFTDDEGEEFSAEKKVCRYIENFYEKYNISLDFSYMSNIDEIFDYENEENEEIQEAYKFLHILLHNFKLMWEYQHLAQYDKDMHEELVKREQGKVEYFEKELRDPDFDPVFKEGIYLDIFREFKKGVNEKANAEKIRKIIEPNTDEEAEYDGTDKNFYEYFYGNESKKVNSAEVKLNKSMYLGMYYDNAYKWNIEVTQAKKLFEEHLMDNEFVDLSSIPGIENHVKLMGKGITGEEYIRLIGYTFKAGEFYLNRLIDKFSTFKELESFVNSTFTKIRTYYDMDETKTEIVYEYSKIGLSRADKLIYANQLREILKTYPDYDEIVFEDDEILTTGAVGLVCKNADQVPGKITMPYCLDYEINVLCGYPGGYYSVCAFVCHYILAMQGKTNMNLEKSRNGLINPSSWYFDEKIVSIDNVPVTNAIEYLKIWTGLLGEYIHDDGKDNEE
jgi:hypothetical protein